jgi:UDP-glucose 4-epimerase
VQRARAQVRLIALATRLYFDNNAARTARLLETLQSRAVERIGFSSSCSVYGTP